jgi:hypothetical protein
VQVAVAAVFLGLLGALLAPVASAAEESIFYAVHPAELRGSESTLRLADLPPGFVVQPESPECFEPRHPSEDFGLLEQEEHIPPTPVEAFERANGSPALCSIGFERLYTVPGTGATPLSVRSLAMVLPSPAAAAKALALGPELFEYTLFTGNFKGYGGPSPSLSEEARRWDTNRGAAPGLRNLPGTLLVWRQGSVLSAIYAVSTTYTVAEHGAYEAADRQQAHVFAPSPYLAAEAEDQATFLDNPNIKVPIWWLGPAFEPKGGRSSYFQGAYVGGRESLPGRELSVEYSEGPRLDTWTSSGWAKFSRTATGRRGWSWHCTRSRTVKLAHGHAVIYGSYRRDEATCPSQPAEHFSAHVFLPGVVIAIGEATNSYTLSFGTDSYNSWRGLTAVVKALRLRR